MMKKFINLLGIVEMPLLLALISVMHYNMDNMVWSWAFAMVGAARLLINIATNRSYV